MKEQRQQAADEYASRSCDGDCALCDEVCRKADDHMAFSAGWDACIEYLAHLTWDEAIKEIAAALQEGEQVKTE